MILTKQVSDLIEAFITRWQDDDYSSIDDLSNDIEEIGHELNSLSDMDLVDTSKPLVSAESNG
jgi:hypothetical protein